MVFTDFAKIRFRSRLIYGMIICVPALRPDILQMIKESLLPCKILILIFLKFRFTLPGFPVPLFISVKSAYARLFPTGEEI